jgi:hypothetical protein
MTRGLSAGNLSAIAQSHIRPIVFVKLEFDGGTEYVHNAVGTFTWGSQTWTGIGAVGQISALEEGLDLSPFGVTMQLNALNPDLMAIATGEEVFNRRVTIYIGYLDENGALVADPQERWSGYMDHVSIRLGGEDGIMLQCENDFRFFDRANGSLFTDEDQQRRYPGDVFFEFLDQMIDAQITWGPGGGTSRLGVPATPRRLPGGPLPPSSPPNGPRHGVGR